nr:MAG TPA: hypothetical protein [Caudoviricetes sp.]
MEFSEVMKQAQRICMIYSDNYCQHCPLCDENENCEMGTFSEKSFDAQALETAIMDWAKQNPKPVYPSWEEGWKQIFPDALYTPCPANYGKKYKNTSCASVSCERCRERPIPAEIAEKLGIKPVVKEWEQ